MEICLLCTSLNSGCGLGLRGCLLRFDALQGANTFSRQRQRLLVGYFEVVLADLPCGFAVWALDFGV